MARLKIYTVPEHRDSYLAGDVGKAAQVGQHHQGCVYVAAHTKAAAAERLRSLGMGGLDRHLRTVPATNLHPALAAMLLAPGDLIAYVAAHKDRPVVHLYGADTRPTVCGHWRYGQTGPHALDRDIYLEIDCDDLAH